MGQDEINLKVLQASGEPAERRTRYKGVQLLERAQTRCWSRCCWGTLLNTNETLPIVLDRSLGGGWQAVLGSTVLIVIFGEIVPQSVCVRFGMPIGAFYGTIHAGADVAPGARRVPDCTIVGFLLGQDHGTTYKKMA